MVSDKQKTRKNSPSKCIAFLKNGNEANAKAASMSLSTFLLTVGQGYKATGIVDFEQVREMACISGDLLKLWLTNDVRTSQFGEATIRTLLNRIEAKQDEIGQIMKSVVHPKTKS
jgi:hypothetical protein